MLDFILHEPQESAQGCVIWMHGLGSDAQDMKGLAAQLPMAQPLRHVFVNAPVRPVTLNNGMRMRAWYDIFGLKFTAREDKAGILESYEALLDVIQGQIKAGFQPETIVLAGFSQGGALALYTALHYDQPLAGVIALSSYLPISAECQPTLPKKVPFFIGYGQFDPLVLPEWTRHSKECLNNLGYEQVTLRHYPMEHSVCMEEIQEIGSWLAKGVAVV